VVKEATIALMLSPEPIPVEVISELPVAVPAAEELAVPVLPVEEVMAELMNTYLTMVGYSKYRRSVSRL
jgi:hypothetical protein